MKKYKKRYNKKYKNCIGPYHDFVLMPRKFSYKEGYEKYAHEKWREFRAVRLSDYLIDYLGDSILQIKTLESASGEYKEVNGIDRWGVNIFEKNGAITTQNILISWRDEIMEADDPVEFNIRKTEYRVKSFSIPKDELLDTIEELAYFCHKVIEGKYWILHWGI